MEITVNTNILWAMFFVFLIIFSILIPTFNYHWNKYGVSDKRRRLAQIIYFGVSSVILLILAIFIFIYTKTNVI
jgi:hypothetical protein